MKVLYLATGVFDKGGISRYSRYQIEGLRASAGVEQVFVMSLHPPSGDVFEEDIEVQEAYNGISVSSKMRFALDALRIACRLRPNVVWANHVGLSSVALVAATSVGATSVTNIYGREMWSGLRGLKLWALRHCDRIVSDCQFTANWTIKHLGLRGERIRVIRDCVDTRKFTPGPVEPSIARKYGVPLTPGRLRLMTVGRLEDVQMHKGYHRIIRLLAQAGGKVDADYIIGGDGPALPDLRRLARSLGTAERVHFTGSITEQDLAAVYRLADVFVLISDRGPGRGEGIPLTPLEAAACGRPLLVGNEDGSQEAVQDGVNGFVLSPYDKELIMDRIVLLSEDPGLRHRMGEAARARIEKLHSFEDFARATLSIVT